jgi:hypothetical protein
LRVQAIPSGTWGQDPPPTRGPPRSSPPIISPKLRLGEPNWNSSVGSSWKGTTGIDGNNVVRSTPVGNWKGKVEGTAGIDGNVVVTTPPVGNWNGELAIAVVNVGKVVKELLSPPPTKPNSSGSGARDLGPPRRLLSVAWAQAPRRSRRQLVVIFPFIVGYVDYGCDGSCYLFYDHRSIIVFQQHSWDMFGSDFGSCQYLVVSIDIGRVNTITNDKP